MIDKIKAEIERRWEEANAKYKETCDHTYDGMCTALDHLESFIESLEKERATIESNYPEYNPNEYESFEDGNATGLRRKEQPKGYDESYLKEKIAEAKKSWDGVDVDKYMDEVRGREQKIKGWVARDENGDLYAFVKKPERSLGEFELKDKTLWEDFTGNGSIRLPKEDFSDLKWEDSPIEVELLVKRV